ncbi:nuclear transport factor 2 family protein [Kribbella sp. NPDC049584]|uniref:nuclear transport factor 2 family protein n=1 Tax=Kribbella sp. NPDC049584 TaxID=3154833 RepID=UPI0034471648
MDINGLSDSSLHEAETRFQQALLANDIAALDRMLHADVRFTGPDGSTIDKAADMASHRSQAFTLTAVDELHREVQIIDGVGITRATLHLVGAAGEHELDMVLAYTRTWLPSEDGWRIIAAHGGIGAAIDTA